MQKLTQQFVYKLRRKTDKLWYSDTVYSQWTANDFGAKEWKSYTLLNLDIIKSFQQITSDSPWDNVDSSIRANWKNIEIVKIMRTNEVREVIDLKNSLPAKALVCLL